MKALLLLTIWLTTTLFGDRVLLLQKGWQLVGSTQEIKDLSIFPKESVDQVWHFDASTQKWIGYSPDTGTMKKINDKGFATIQTLKSWHGFWVKSKES